MSHRSGSLLPFLRGWERHSSLILLLLLFLLPISRSRETESSFLSSRRSLFWQTEDILSGNGPIAQSSCAASVYSDAAQTAVSPSFRQATDSHGATIYRVGVLITTDAKTVYEEWNTTFAEYLTTTIYTVSRLLRPNISFEVVPLSFENLFEDIESKTDFIFVNPSAFSCVESELGAQSLVTLMNHRKGHSGRRYNLKEFGGVIFVKNDPEHDHIQTIQDLKDTRIACSSISALGSGQMQFHEMMLSGMSYINDPKQLVFTSNQEKVVEEVLKGTVDVGFVRTDQLERSFGLDGTPLDLDSEIRIIQPRNSSRDDDVQIGDLFPFQTSTDTYPEWNVAALNHVPTVVREAVQNSLLALLDHAQVGDVYIRCIIGEEPIAFNPDDPDDCSLETIRNVMRPHVDVRLDTTLELGILAARARNEGNFVHFIPSLSYTPIRNMLEATGFMNLVPADENSFTTFRCIRSTTLFETIACPAGYRRKSLAAVEAGCERQGLDCEEEYQCICRPCELILECNNGVLMWEKCIPFRIFLPSVLVPVFFVLVAIMLWYGEQKRNEADALFQIDREELKFGFPPTILGQGTFGQVLLAEYRGTHVAVKRVIPKNVHSRMHPWARYFGNHEDVDAPEVNALFDFSRHDVSEIHQSFSSMPSPLGHSVRFAAHLQSPNNRNRIKHSGGLSSSGRSGGRNGGDISASSPEYADVESGSQLTTSANLGLVSVTPMSIKKGRKLVRNVDEGHTTSLTSSRRRSKSVSYKRLRNNFIAEIKHLSQLRHPCITTVMGCVVSKLEEPMLVMEYMNLGSLFRCLHNPYMVISFEQRKKILQNIAKGLRFLHNSDPVIVHGDVKSQNVLIDDNFNAKVTDFGFSAKRKSSAAAGTPFWMAPELLNGRSGNNTKTDIYSFGIVIFEVMTRSIPYAGEAYEQVMKDICDPAVKKRPELDTTGAQSVSPRICELYNLCVHANPDTRPTASRVDLTLQIDEQVQKSTDYLEAHNKELEEANYKIAASAALQLEHFASMSHEIRTPLNCMIGLSSLMAESELDEAQRETMKMIMSSGDLLRSIVDDVLDYSKLESGKVEIEASDVNLQGVLESILQQMRLSPLTKEKRLCIRARYHQSLSETLKIDSRRLQQILYNLLSNAVKFSSPNGVVELTASIDDHVDSPLYVSPSDEQIIRFSVLDHGKGIDKSDYSKIFKPFAQTKAGVENLEGGTGLGLAITKRLVEAMDGSISVTSSVGEWTQFNVDFPFPLERPNLDHVAKKLESVSIFLIGNDSCNSSPSYDIRNTLEVLSTANVPFTHCDNVFTFAEQWEKRPNKEAKSIVVLHEAVYARFRKSKCGTSDDCPQTITFGRQFKARSSDLHFSCLSDLFPVVFLRGLVSCVDNKGKFRRSSSDRHSMDGSALGLQQFEKLRILVADDNRVNQKVLQRMLSRLGVATIEVVSDGQEAVDAEASRAFDLVFMDVHMPKMDGLDAIAGIRKRVTGQHPQAKVVFLTGQVSAQFEAECFEKGAAGFLPKPCTYESVKTTIAKIMKFTDDETEGDVQSKNTLENMSGESIDSDVEDDTPPKIPFSSMRALVADDIVVNQKVLKRILARIGIQDIMVVDNGKKAADLEASKEFDVVFMDLQMPVMDGMEATRLITARTDQGHPPARVIFVTAHVSEQFRKSCLETGAVGYLPKPCSVQSVKDCLQETFPEYG